VPPKVMPLKVRVACPLLLTVTVCAGAWVPVMTEPKLTLAAAAP
jgi:hypothetical protein